MVAGSDHVCVQPSDCEFPGTDFFSNVVLRAPRGEEEDGEEDGREKEGEGEEEEDEESEEEEDDEDEESEKVRDSKEEEEEEEEEDEGEKEVLKKERVEEEDEEGEEEESEMDGDEAKDTELVAIEQSCLILQYILQCLTKCFLYDKTGFLSKERFDSLLQPLVGQVRLIATGMTRLGSSARRGLTLSYNHWWGR